MKVFKVDGMYKAARITGPTHNYLGAIVVLHNPKTIRCIARQTRDEDPHQIDEKKLLACVTEKVSAANLESGLSLYIEYIEYVPSDTPDYRAYAELTSAILLRASCDLTAP